MYIEPNTEIRILKNCPLDSTYEHTLFFYNKTAQYDYFAGLTKYNLQRQSYQRQGRGVMRVELKAENLFDCNYLMFRNNTFGTKVFYAFITNVDYVNNNTAEITYELDVMQTWLFDWWFDECFVVREHSATDMIGDNLIPEPVNCGTYVTGMPFSTGKFTDWKIVVVSTGRIDGGGIPGLQPANGGFFAGTYGSCDYNIFPATSTGVAQIHTLLNQLAFWNNPEVIAAMYMIPSIFIPADPASFDTAIESRANAYLKAGDFRVPFNATGATQYGEATIFGGYRPRNNKMYTYPYNYFICDNGQGTVKEYKFEYFDKTIGRVFNLVSDYGVEPCVMCVPQGYMQKRQGIGEITDMMADSISITNFPKCTWATTDLGAKLVQGGIHLALLAATRGASAAWWSSGGVSGERFEPLMTNGSYALPAANELSTQRPNHIPLHGYEGTSGSMNMRLHPEDAIIAGYITNSVFNSHMTSNIGRGNTTYVADWFDFTFKQVFLDRPFAETIDDFFTAYGYQTNRLKTPNRTARPHWNYVRTANCTLKGSVPADDMRKICAIHDKGITYWKHGNEVGNYSLNNSPT